MKKNDSVQTGEIVPVQESTGKFIKAVAEAAKNYPPIIGGGGTLTIRLNNCSLEVTKKDACGTVTQTTMLPGFKQASVGNIRGLSLEDQKNTVSSLRNQGLTQTQTASKLGVSQALISKIERS